MIDITWLGPESWLGVRLGTWILIVFLLSLPFLMEYVFAKQDWYKRFNDNALLQRRLFYTMAPLLLLVMGYGIYLLVLEVTSGVREFGFVWIPQGVLVFAAAGLFLAKGSLLLWKPLEGPNYTRNWRQGYVGVFRDGLEFSIVGLLLGLATGDRAAVDDAAFAFGILGIILSIIGETIKCFRHLRRTAGDARTIP
ncbi:MAG: hypothetical protein OXL97_14565 [Chloroflexota bacterium]|nr:hypothetical protein [Chloroflexota bacterium]